MSSASAPVTAAALISWIVSSWGDPKDTYYETRRSHATVVTLACGAPEETCFCTVFGIDPANPAGDVTAWKAGQWLCLRANTKKGEKLLASLPMLQNGGEDAVVAAQAAIHAVTEKLPLKDLDLTGFDGDHLMEKFNSPQWAQLSESCLGCGSCTFVCPTCQCYDIKDFNTVMRSSASAAGTAVCTLISP